MIQLWYKIKEAPLWAKLAGAFYLLCLVRDQVPYELTHPYVVTTTAVFIALIICALRALYMWVEKK